MTAPAHPQTRKLFVLQCQTCKNTNCPIFTNEKDRYFIQEKSWCEEKYRDFVSKVNLCGCASHSSVQSRDQVLDELMKWIDDDYGYTEGEDWLLDDIMNYLKELRTRQEAQR